MSPKWEHLMVGQKIKLNEELRLFIKYKDCKIVELYCCEVKEARQ